MVRSLCVVLDVCCVWCVLLCASCLLRIVQLGVQTWPGTKHPLHPFALLSFLNFPVLGVCGSRLDNPVVLFVRLLPDAAVEAVPRASSALAAAELGARAPKVDGTCPEPGSPKRKANFCMRSSQKRRWYEFARGFKVGKSVFVFAPPGLWKNKFMLEEPFSVREGMKPEERCKLERMMPGQGQAVW